MKIILILFVLMAGFFSISGATLVPYEDFEGKLDIVLDKIDEIIELDDSMEKSDVFSLISKLLREKHIRGDLSEKHKSIFAHLLAHYHSLSGRSDEGSIYIYSAIQELDYFVCETHNDCRVFEDDTDRPGIPPSVNFDSIDIIDSNTMIYLPPPLSSGRQAGAQDAPKTSYSIKSPQCVQSYCVTEWGIGTRTYEYKGSSVLLR